MTMIWFFGLFPLVLIIIGIVKRDSVDTVIRKNGKILILIGVILYGIPLLMGLALLAVCSNKF